jgi:hypothetical protein
LLRRALRLGCLALGLACAPAQAADPPAPPAEARSLAVWRLKPLGMDAPTAGRLEALLRAEADRLPGFRLQAPEETERLLAGQDALAACGGETQCLCAIGATLGVELLVTGLLGELGDDYTFDLKLVSVQPCQERSRINEALSGREDLLIGAIRQALYKLVAPDRLVGSLVVEVPVEGAEVSLDDRLVGRTPLGEPIGGLRPGLHRLRIAKPGLSEFQDDVPVRFQQVTKVKVDLVSSALTGLTYEKEAVAQAEEAARPVAAVAAPPPDRSLWIAGWTLTGLGLAAGAVAGVLAWRVWVIEDELEAAAGGEPPYLHASHQDMYERGQAFSLGANIGFGVGGAVALTGVILLIVDAVQGPASPEPAGAADTRAPQVRLLPAGPGLVLDARF